jgi:hypothetical protein
MNDVQVVKLRTGIVCTLVGKTVEVTMPEAKAQRLQILNLIWKP